MKDSLLSFLYASNFECCYSYTIDLTVVFRGCPTEIRSGGGGDGCVSIQKLWRPGGMRFFSDGGPIHARVPIQAHPQFS